MSESQLHHIYQAWQQGNEHYERDWSYFVEYAAKTLDKPAVDVMRVLQRCYWFKYYIEE